jgi:hypothetical protein
MSFNVRRGAGASVRGGGDGARRPFEEMTRSYIGGVVFEGIKERMCVTSTSKCLSSRGGVRGEQGAKVTLKRATAGVDVVGRAMERAECGHGEGFGVGEKVLGFTSVGSAGFETRGFETFSHVWVFSMQRGVCGVDAHARVAEFSEVWDRGKQRRVRVGWFQALERFDGAQKRRRRCGHAARTKVPVREYAPWNDCK